MNQEGVRQQIVREYVPKLVQALAATQGVLLQDSGKQGLRTFVRKAMSIISKQKYRKTDSYKVKQLLDEMRHKFFVDNLVEHGDRLVHMCNVIIHNPRCVDHYETDLQWSLLDFLLTVARSPTRELRINGNKINFIVPQDFSDDELEKQKEKEECLADLQADLLPHTTWDSDSDLSEWSDSEKHEIHQAPVNSCQKALPIVKLCDHLPPLTPPEKELPYTAYDTNNIAQRLSLNVQHSWWLPHPTETIIHVHSNLMEANFAITYSKFISKSSKQRVKSPEPSVCAERYLIRELIWMFQKSRNCKFFKSKSDKPNISLHFNITIPSISMDTFQSFFQSNLLPYVDMMNELQSFVKSVVWYESTLPETLACYATSLRCLMHPIWKSILEYEKRLTTPRNNEIITIMSFYNEMLEPLKKLKYIYELHVQIAPKLGKVPPHICSVYILSALLEYNKGATSKMQSHLSLSLFLASIKAFCGIIDLWWTEGRLEDFQEEFVVQNAGLLDLNMRQRQFEITEENKFDGSNYMLPLINSSKFFSLIVEHSLEAGRTLNLLNNINRISDLRASCIDVKAKFYDVFIEDVMSQLDKMKPVREVSSQNEIQDIIQIDSNKISSNKSMQTDEIEKFIQQLGITDKFLLSTFLTNMNFENDDKMLENSDMNALKILESLEQNEYFLPYEEIIIDSLSNILTTRIATANKFVVRMFLDELNLLQHLQNLRKVLLLEASDVMYEFYGKLFYEIENESLWVQSMSLSSQLNSSISTFHPNMSQLFRVEIKSAFRCQTVKVCEAIDELTIAYDCRPELSYVISAQDMHNYNAVFRFLLKVKWGLMTLESMRFSRVTRRRQPYTQLTMTSVTMRRFEQLRFWMLSCLNNVHFHLMTHVLQTMGERLDKLLVKCRNLREMQIVHESYVNTVCEYCFLTDACRGLRMGVEQLITLVFITRLEWDCCVKFMEQNHPLAPESFEEQNSENASSNTNYVNEAQIDELEVTFIRCHQYLGNLLTQEVYVNQNTHLSGLCAAFNTSVPY